MKNLVTALAVGALGLGVWCLGGALIISYFGAGPLSLDAFAEGEKHMIDCNVCTVANLNAITDHPQQARAFAETQDQRFPSTSQERTKFHRLEGVCHRSKVNWVVCCINYSLCHHR